MCGIVGYIGERDGQKLLLNGLKCLEYRGYDSSGMAIYLEKKKAISLRKLSGKVKNLEVLLEKKPLFGSLGIAHTRWATHGPPNQLNAHPHLDCKGEIALVHNGIIENYREIKQMLLKETHTFRSQTDTEVIVHLIEKFYYKDASLEEATRRAAKLLKGSFAIALFSDREPDKLIGARCGSPLIVGLGDKENFLASDVPAILDYTKKVIFLEENELVVLEKERVKITNFEGEIIKREPVNISWTKEEAQKQGFPHFMLKEILEQPQVLEKILEQRIKDSGIFFEELGSSSPVLLSKKLSQIKNIFIVACGTAYHAGLVGKYILESLCRIPVLAEVSSEFRYHSSFLIDKDTLVIAISQSGETADTLASVRQAKMQGAEVISICNVLGSTLTRESDAVIYTHAGPEISVASTKTYTAQLMILYLFALYLAVLKETLSKDRINDYLEMLKQIPPKQRQILSNLKIIREIARKHSHFGSFLYLGRNINYPSALEGALKLKEISYIPAEGYAAGEMKHGPIALIDEYRAVVCIIPESKLYDKMLSNIQEIKSRSGKVIAIASEEDRKIKELVSQVIYIPKIEELFSPLLVALPLQLMAYYIAVKRKCNVDQPRNLAKSVTVE
ncbi:MAG: glutamine--fructose-6-phosphate transaminase (isomerizing) [Candidatus Omnitrophica bacterium]|nr:glutamine--fructose-6-phosphate transaminase (isomerizing) [Candidatus Omnitrophota bacterium]